MIYDFRASCDAITIRIQRQRFVSYSTFLTVKLDILLFIPFHASLAPCFYAIEYTKSRWYIDSRDVSPRSPSMFYHRSNRWRAGWRIITIPIIRYRQNNTRNETPETCDDTTLNSSANNLYRNIYYILYGRITSRSHTDRLYVTDNNEFKIYISCVSVGRIKWYIHTYCIIYHRGYILYKYIKYVIRRQRWSERGSLIVYSRCRSIMEFQSRLIEWTLDVWLREI